MDKVDKIVEEYSHIWKTRSAFFSWIKGVIRKGWSKHPSRIEYLKSRAKRIPNVNPRSMRRFPEVNAWECEICNGTFKQSEIEVDHKLEETASLTKLEDVQSCVEKLLCVQSSDLRVLCKGCHSVVSLSQSLGISFDEALVEKEVIALCKDAKKCLAYLAEKGYTGVAVSNAEKRRTLVRQLMKKEKEE